MKALFYGGAIAAVAGMALGMSMTIPREHPAAPAEPQPAAQQVADYAPASETYDTAPEAYPSYYALDAAYAGDPAVLSPDTESSPAQSAADQVLKASWQPPAETAEATPQDVAAAGDTTPAPEQPRAAPQEATQPSIDALLNQQEAAKGRLHNPGF